MIGFFFQRHRPPLPCQPISTIWTSFVLLPVGHPAGLMEGWMEGWLQKFLTAARSIDDVRYIKYCHKVCVLYICIIVLHDINPIILVITSDILFFRACMIQGSRIQDSGVPILIIYNGISNTPYGAKLVS